MAFRTSTRRRFLEATATAAATLPVLAAPLGRARSDHAVFVRRNIHDLGPAADGTPHPIVAAYRSAVDVMRTRPVSDPTSWMFQANIHGSTDAFPDPAWNQCRHGSFFFLSWHRMYLHFFERIVRAAAGDPQFALPYWNYSDDSRQAVLPTPFREPADEAGNPLFTTLRHPAVNGGVTLPDVFTSYEAAFQVVNFTTSGTDVGFGGDPVAADVVNTQSHGELESQPHDILHVVVGGDPTFGAPGIGLMTDPRTAAQDPIFWLHHANIDRLWERWLALGEGRGNPADATWLETAFTFFDEDGDAVELSGAEILDVVNQLGYTYDDAPEVVVPPPAPEVVLVASAESAPEVVAGGAEGGTVRLGAGANRVPLEGSGAAPEAVPELASGERVLLDIGVIRSNQPIGSFYQVYLNLPEGEVPDPNGIYFVGNFSFFARTADENRCTDGSCGQIFDVTRLARRQIEEGVWNEGAPVVTFVLAGLPAAGTEEIALPEGAEPEVGDIRIVRK